MPFRPRGGVGVASTAYVPTTRADRVTPAVRGVMPNVLWTCSFEELEAGGAQPCQRRHTGEVRHRERSPCGARRDRDYSFRRSRRSRRGRRFLQWPGPGAVGAPTTAQSTCRRWGARWPWIPCATCELPSAKFGVKGAYWPHRGDRPGRPIPTEWLDFGPPESGQNWTPATPLRARAARFPSAPDSRPTSRITCLRRRQARAR